MKSSRAILTTLTMLMLIALPAATRGNGVPAVDPSAAIDLEGTVVSFTAGPSVPRPTLVVDDATRGEIAVRLGPSWYLTEKGFTATAGDRVRIHAYPCSACEAPYTAAEIENLSHPATLTLRDAEGTPFWRSDRPRGRNRGAGPGAGRGPEGGGPRAGRGYGPGEGRGQGRGMGPCGAGAGPRLGQGRGRGDRGAGCRCAQGDRPAALPDLGAATTVTGTVHSFSGGRGAGRLTLLLEVEGSELSVQAGPYRAWAGAGFEPAPGQTLTVTYAPVDRAGSTRLIALTVADPATGATVQLRDPATGRRRGGRGWGRG